MDASDVVYNGIYKGAKNKGASERSSLNHALLGVKLFKQSSFPDKSVGKMIDRLISSALKESKSPKNKPTAKSFIPRNPQSKQKNKPKIKRSPVKNAQRNFVSKKVKDRKFKSSDGLWSNKI